jgi:hypothetical protein
MKIGISQRSRFLPTEDEIRSDDPEFLPSTDLDQPCFLTDAMAPHLDTHFRLLRHDIFRELKEAFHHSTRCAMQSTMKGVLRESISAQGWGGAAYGDFKPTQVISIALSRFIG